MGVLSHTDIISFLTAFGTILIASRLISEVVRKFKMPVVLGEIIAGIVLGPTILGYFCPAIFDFLFPFISNPVLYANSLIAMDSIVSISVIMLLFVAGMEVQLPLVIEQGKVALLTTIFSMAIPMVVGFGTVYFFPEIFKISTDTNIWIYGSFIGVVLSITALPVIARIMMDMGIFKTKIGMIIIASAMFIDMLSWLIFSVLLSTIDGSIEKHSLTYTIISILVFGVLTLTIGTRLINAALPWIQTKFSWPGGVLSLAFGVCFLGAAFTESIGIHSILGAFIVGIAVGDSANLRERTNEIIHQFVTNVFAPVFFVSIGLYINFIDNFNWLLVVVMLLIAYVSKISGAKIGAMFGGLNNRDSWAVGTSMNTHGALEIILGTLALKANLINEEVFVAIIVMVVVTIITASPMIKRFTK